MKNLDLKRIAAGVVAVVTETAKRSIDKAKETVILTVPIFHKMSLYYQNVVRDKEGSITERPPHLHNAFAPGFPAYKAVKSLVQPPPSGDEVEGKVLATRTKGLITKLSAHNMFGQCLSIQEISMVRRIPPLQQKERLPSFDDYVSGPETEASWDNSGIVTVRERRFDRREGTDQKINWLINRILGDRARVFLEFMALAVFSDRIGKARPITHFLGVPGTCKSVLAEAFEAVVGLSLCGVLTVKEASRRWMFPSEAYYKIDENAEIADNSKKNLWGFLKNLTKSLGKTQWERKYRQPVDFAVGAYLVCATNDPIVAASEVDEIDNVNGITLTEKLNSDDLKLDGVDVPEYLRGLDGMPLEFVEKTLWPIFCALDDNHRFGMRIYKDDDYTDSEKTDTQKLRDEQFRSIETYCRYVAYVRKYKLSLEKSVINSIIGYEECSYGLDKKFIQASVAFIKNDGVPVAFLKQILGRGRSASVDAMKLLKARGVDFKKVNRKNNPDSLEGHRFLFLPSDLFTEPLTDEEFADIKGPTDSTTKYFSNLERTNEALEEQVVDLGEELAAAAAKLDSADVNLALLEEIEDAENLDPEEFKRNALALVAKKKRAAKQLELSPEEGF